MLGGRKPSNEPDPVLEQLRCRKAAGGPDTDLEQLRGRKAAGARGADETPMESEETREKGHTANSIFTKYDHEEWEEFEEVDAITTN